MKTLYRSNILLFTWLLAIVLFASDQVSGSDRKKGSTHLDKVSTQEWKNFDINAINCTINSSGPYADYLRTNASGLEWPRGSKKTAVYTAGVWVVGVHRPTGALRTAVQDYQTEFQPGPILTTFNTTTNDASAAADPADPRYHIYKVERKDSVGGNPDYDNWPGDLGAPYIDVDHDGKWTPGVDKPKFWGDQQLWCVYNDANFTNHAHTGTTQPMGIEIQTTYFGYNQAGSLGNTMFMRWKIINKSDADYDSVFISMWSDTDLGGANDDYVGVDVPRKLSYVYNANNNDAMYGNMPPADGFVFFEGPRIPHPDSTCLFEGNILKGYYNKPATSHVMYINTDPTYSDPPLGNPLFPGSAYGYQNGFIGGSQQPFIDPTTSASTKFVMNGDPVAGTGWTMDKSFPGGRDVRSMISSGPFTLAKGDTQEIVGGFVIAGGGDRLKSVTLLRQFCDAAQNAFNSNFKVPTAKVATSISGTNAQLTIVADGSLADAASMQGALTNGGGAQIASITLYDDGAHGDGAAGDKVFGNTYSLPSRAEGLFLDLTVTDTKSKSTLWPRIVQGITTSSLRVTNPVVFADNLNSDGVVNNGENVRFGFTINDTSPFAFSNVNIAAFPETFSKAISIPSVPAGTAITLLYNTADLNTFLSFDVPASYSGSTYQIYLGLADDNNNVWVDSVAFPVVPYQQKIAVMQHFRGSAYGSPTIGIVAPNLIKNDTYIITGVDSVDVNMNSGITIKDSTDGRILLQNAPLPDPLAQTNSPILDGFKVFLGTLRSQLYAGGNPRTPDSLRWFAGSWDIFWGTYLGKNFSSLSGPSILNKGDYRKVEVRFSPKKSYIDQNSNGRYDVGEPYVVDSLNTNAAQKAYFYSKPLFSAAKFSGFYWVPFAVYDMDVNPPRQLSVVVLDNEANNQWDIDPISGTSKKNYVWILSDAYDPSGKSFDPTQGGTDFGALAVKRSASFYYVLWFVEKTPGIEAYSTNYAVRFIPSYPLSSKDAYIFNPTVYTGNIGNHPTIVEEFSLDQNFPNPFNPSTQVRFTTAAFGFVTLKVYDVLGREVVTLVNEPKPIGTYTVSFDASRLATGVYFYQLHAGSFMETKKMIVVK